MEWLPPASNFLLNGNSTGWSVVAVLRAIFLDDEKKKKKKKEKHDLQTPSNQSCSVARHRFHLIIVYCGKLTCCVLHSR